MTRRGRGEGTIRLRNDGRWEASTMLGVQRKSFYGKTRREVTEKLRAAQRDYEAGQFIGDARQTVEQYLSSWLEVKRNEVKPGTWQGYEIVVRRHIVPLIGRVKLTQLTAQHVQQVITSGLRGGLSGSRVGLIYSALHQALQAAERLGLVMRDVSGRVARPHARAHEMRVLSAVEARQLLEYCQSPHGARFGVATGTVMRVALATGMREGELLALRWRQVDLDGGWLSVIGTMRWVGGQPVYDTPKTRRSRRRLAIDASTLVALKAWRQTQRILRLRAGAAWQGEQYDAVFTDELGFPLQASTTQRRFKRLLAAAGVRQIRFHDLRHTCATLLLSAGVHPKIVSEMLGHASVSITLDLYSHVLPHMQDDASRALGALLDGDGHAPMAEGATGEAKGF